MQKRLITLDADGVLIDYHEGYAMAWEQAFGYRPEVKDPLGYHPRHYWDVPLLGEAARKHLSTHGFTENIWGAMPAIPGALEACKLLQQAGNRLICVTALSPAMRDARAEDLKTMGFEIEAVHAVGASLGGNPKRKCIEALAPAVFVDDYLPYLQGVPLPVWRALIDTRPNNSPNYHESLEQPQSRHSTLLEFVRWWLARNEGGFATKPSGAS